MTKEEVCSLFEYKDGFLFWRSQPHSVDTSKTAGTVNENGYRIIGINKKRYRAHRLIFLMHYGYIPEFIDHIDGNPGNNKIGNLRAATKNQNEYNTGKRKNNTSGFKGVSWHSQKNKWRATIFINSRQMTLGLFETPEEAFDAYCRASKKFHGEFSNYGAAK